MAERTLYFLNLLAFKEGAGKRGDDPIEEHEYPITPEDFKNLKDLYGGKE